MEQLPHRYIVSVTGSPQGNLATTSDNLPALAVAPPKQFDGPGDQWSPEELLMAAVANCLVLSFRAIASASKLEWQSIECESEGELAKVDRNIFFTAIQTRATLTVSSIEEKEKAGKLLEKAEESCFISNSLSAKSTLEYEILVDAG